MTPSKARPRVLEPKDVRRIPMLNLPYGDVPVIHASAGMRRVLALAYMFVWAWEKHVEVCESLGIPPETRMVFLFDEAEDHLHPLWQRVIVPALLKAIKHMQQDMSVQVLMTTHSPMVLASLEPHFDESRDQLFWLHLQNKTVELDPVAWKKYGNATGWLTSPIFGLPEARSPEAEHAIAKARAFLRSGRSEPGEARQLQNDLGKWLPVLDPFWTLWTVGLQRLALKVDEP